MFIWISLFVPQCRSVIIEFWYRYSNLLKHQYDKIIHCWPPNLNPCLQTNVCYFWWPTKSRCVGRTRGAAVQPQLTLGNAPLVRLYEYNPTQLSVSVSYQIVILIRNIQFFQIIYSNVWEKQEGLDLVWQNGGQKPPPCQFGKSSIVGKSFALWERNFLSQALITWWIMNCVHYAQIGDIRFTYSEPVT